MSGGDQIGWRWVGLGVGVIGAVLGLAVLAQWLVSLSLGAEPLRKAIIIAGFVGGFVAGGAVVASRCPGEGRREPVIAAAVAASLTGLVVALTTPGDGGWKGALALLVLGYGLGGAGGEAGRRYRRNKAIDRMSL